MRIYNLATLIEQPILIHIERKMMKRYRIKVIKKYVFDLDGESKADINTQLNTVMNESNILDLPYVKKNIQVKIRKIRKENGNEKNN